MKIKMIEILIESQRYYLPTVKIKDYSVMINGHTFFDQTVRNDLRTYDSIRKITTDQGGDYTTGCLLDYPHFEKYYSANSSRFKQTTRCWSENNATN